MNMEALNAVRMRLQRAGSRPYAELSPQQEADWVTKFQAGNKYYATLLYRYHAFTLLRFARPLCRCGFGIDDALQEVSLYWYNALSTVDVSRSRVTTFVAVIVRRRISQKQQSTILRQGVFVDTEAAQESALAVACPRPLPCIELERDQSVARIRSEVSALDPKQQRALTSVYSEEHNGNVLQTAIALGMNPKTLAYQTEAAINSIRRSLRMKERTAANAEGRG